MTTAHCIDQDGPMAIAIEYTSLHFNVDAVPADVFEIPQGVQETIGK